MAFGIDDFAVAVGLTGLAKEVLWPLLKGSLEDYTKDFFKGCIEDVAGLAGQEPVQKAMGKALKAFVELMSAELEYAGLTGAEIRDFYQPALRAYMKDVDVKATLGAAFEPDCRTIDDQQLREQWTELDLRQLPDDFDWEQISKQYVRQVKGIWRESPELRELLTLHNQEAIRQGVESLVGIEPDFDLRKYQEGLREQYGNLKLESLDTSAYAYNELKLWRMFIPQDVRPCQEFNPKVYEIPKEKLQELQERGELDAEELEAAQLETYRRSYVEQLPANVLEVVGRTAGKGERSRPLADYAVILGDPGSGKSTLLQYMALEWAAEPIGSMRELEQRPLPLLIELRKYAKDRQEKKCSSVVEYLHQGEVVCRLNQHQVDEVLQQGNAVALFDGIDEVFDPHLREMVVTDIHRFTNDYSAVQTVVTSRWLGYKAQTLRDAGFQHYMLQDLDEEQIKEFVERWHDQTFPEGADKQRKRERLHKAISDSKSIRELAGNPLLLTMMAILNRNQELPRDRPELYNQASRVLLHQWDVERNLIEHRLDPLTIDYADKQAMLRQVADHMQSGKDGLAGNIISAADLERILTEQLQRLDLEQPRTLARLMMKQLRERNFILCFLGADNYAFVHRTFLEYFAAWAFVWKFEKTQEISFEELLEQTFAAHWQDERWHEVLRLIAGMIDPSFLERIIMYLMLQDGELPANVFHDREYPINLPVKFPNIFLAADCYFETRSKVLTAKTLSSLKSKLYELVPYVFDGTDQFGKRVFTSYEVGVKSVFYIAKLFNEDSNNFNSLVDFFEEDNIGFVSAAVVDAIGKFHDDNPLTLPWLKTIIQVKNKQLKNRIVSHTFSNIVDVWKDDAEILSWLQTVVANDQDPVVRQAALRKMAESFKDNPDTLDTLKSCINFDEEIHVRIAAVQELAKGWKNDPEILLILKKLAQSDSVNDVRGVDKEIHVRIAAVQELAKGWKNDPEILLILKKLAQSDSVNDVRRAAVEGLAQGYKDDPEILLILKKLAQSDSVDDVRRAAVEGLAQGYKDDPEILLILKTCVQSDEDNIVRRVAVEGLAQSYKDDPDTLLILKTCAQSDEDNIVRSAAVQELARGYKDDPELFKLVYNRAGNDPYKKSKSYYPLDWNPRYQALKFLTSQYFSHPKTLELLADRAQNDNDDELRKWASKQLAKLEAQS